MLEKATSGLDAQTKKNVEGLFLYIYLYYNIFCCYSNIKKEDNLVNIKVHKERIDSIFL